jgi:HEAT repeat protein
MSTPTSPESKYNTAELISKLGDENGFVRHQARLMLVHIGPESIPALREALKSKNVNTRLEATKALGEFHDPQSASALTDMLVDPETGVRWAAAEGLIQGGRSSLRPLLESFIHNFESPWLREGLHHILHVFKDRNLLREEELTLFTVLNKQEFSRLDMGWTGEAAWAAEKALVALDREKNGA